MNADALQQALVVATEAAREVGTYLLSRRGTAQVQRKKALHDELLDVDLESEARILSALRTAFPNYGLLSEEADADHPEAPCRWVVDPLDGSANYQHGSPLFGVAIALQVQGHTTIGVIYLPVCDELYRALCSTRPFIRASLV
jgi:myo-inositol-1(or 4)-monophosphatase